MAERLTTSEYAKKRREGKKLFACLIDEEIVSQLDEVLYKKRLTKKDWLLAKIKEELQNNEQ